MESLNDREDVVMDVVASWTVGADIEDLCESELIWAIHAEIACYEDENAALNWSFLNIRAHVGILDVVKGERLYFFWNFFESFEAGSGIGHLADILIEVDES